MSAEGRRTDSARPSRGRRHLASEKKGRIRRQRRRGSSFVFYLCAPLDDLVAQSGTNNLGRSRNPENPDLKKFLPVTNPFRENHPKRFKLQIWGPRSAQTENFMKLKISGTPKLCWADQVKFEFWGHLEVKKGQKRKIAKILVPFLGNLLEIEGKSLWKSFKTLSILAAGLSLFIMNYFVSVATRTFVYMTDVYNTCSKHEY